MKKNTFPKTFSEKYYQKAYMKGYNAGKRSEMRKNKEKIEKADKLHNTLEKIKQYIQVRRFVCNS